MIRPSIRTVRPFYSLSFLLIAVYFGLVNNNPDWPNSIRLALLLPAALILWTAYRHVRLRFTRMSVTGNKLRFESGLLSKSTRTLELNKIQDVRVDQTVMQRLLSIGDVAVETAGDAPPLLMKNVDHPQAVADFLLESARG